MECQAIFSMKNNKKEKIKVSSAVVVISALRVIFYAFSVIFER